MNEIKIKRIDITSMTSEKLSEFICENFSWELYDKLRNNELYEAILLLMQNLVELKKGLK